MAIATDVTVTSGGNNSPVAQEVRANLLPKFDSKRLLISFLALLRVYDPLTVSVPLCSLFADHHHQWYTFVWI